MTTLAQRAQHTFLKLHTRVYESSNGAVGSSFLGAPCLLLTTIGAKSGLERTTPLGYAKDNANFVLVASNGGSDRPPNWLSNLRVHPEVRLQVGADHVKGEAWILLPGERQYDRLFGLINAAFGGRYYAYQERTERPLPVVLIAPSS